jgi:uncharacterized protein YndB with AHSA1/START domain
MASVVISCTPEEAFRYSADPEHRSEWHGSVRSSTVETPRPLGVGTRVRERHRGFGEMVCEITHYQPGARWSIRGVEGALRPRETMTFEALDRGAATRVSFEIEYEGSGLGALYATMARRAAARQIRSDLSALRRRLEASGT